MEKLLKIYTNIANFKCLSVILVHFAIFETRLIIIIMVIVLNDRTARNIFKYSKMSLIDIDRNLLVSTSDG